MFFQITRSPVHEISLVPHHILKHPSRSRGRNEVRRGKSVNLPAPVSCVPPLTDSSATASFKSRVKTFFFECLFAFLYVLVDRSTRKTRDRLNLCASRHPFVSYEQLIVSTSTILIFHIPRSISLFKKKRIQRESFFHARLISILFSNIIAQKGEKSWKIHDI